MDSGFDNNRGDQDVIIKMEAITNGESSNGPLTDILFEDGTQDLDFRYEFKPIESLEKFLENDDLLEHSSRYSPNSESTITTARASFSSTSTNTYQDDGDVKPLILDLNTPTARSSVTSSVDYTNSGVHSALGFALDDSVFEEEQEDPSYKPKTGKGRGGAKKSKNQQAAGGADDCGIKKAVGGGKRRAPKRMIPDEEKDSAYWAQRNRNTNAARRCRAKQRGISLLDDPFEEMMTARGMDEKQKVRFRQIRGQVGDLFMKVFDTAKKTYEREVTEGQ